MKNVQELIAAGKAKKLKVASRRWAASTTSRSWASRARRDSRCRPIPFRGGGDIVINVVSNNLDLGMLNYAEAESQIKAGDVRPMMVLAAKRLKVLPDVPTAKELGIDAEYDTVRGFVTLKGTPDDRLKVLEEGLLKAMKGQMYSTYIETSGQAADSVVGRAAWQAQLDAMYGGRNRLAGRHGTEVTPMRRTGRGRRRRGARRLRGGLRAHLPLHDDAPGAMMSGMGAEFFPRLVIGVIAVLAVGIAFGIGTRR